MKYEVEIHVVLTVQQAQYCTVAAIRSTILCCMLCIYYIYICIYIYTVYIYIYISVVHSSYTPRARSSLGVELR